MDKLHNLSNSVNNTIMTFNETYVLNDTFNFVQNISSIISNQVAESYLFCHMTVYDMYLYYLQQAEIHKNWLDWLQAYLQNLIS